MKKRNSLFSLFGVSLLATMLLAGCSGLANPLKKAKITFDPSRVSCTLPQNNKAEIKSGTLIAENTALYFTAKLPEGKDVKAWTVNGSKKGSTVSFLYYVNLKELKLKNGAEITVSFSEQDAQMITVTFDKEKVLAYKVPANAAPATQGTSIDSGTAYKKGDKLNFIAKPTKGMAVDHWLINGKKPEGPSGGNDYMYTINADHADSKKTINVSFTEKEAMVAVTFDEEKVTCSHRYHDNSTGMFVTVNYLSGKELPLGTTLTFTATLDTGKSVANWYVSEHKQEVKEGASEQFDYTIDARDIKDTNGKKTIAIRYEVTDEEKVKVKFDEAKIYCTEAPNNEWAAGKSFTFYAKLADNETVEKWMVNGINGRDITIDAYGAKNYTVSYTVALSDAKDGVIEISYTTVTTTVKVNFSKNEIFCAHASGKEWKKGDSIQFKAKVPVGEVLEDWYVSGKKQNMSGNTFNYYLKAEDAKDGVIEVTRKLYDKVKITFDKEKVKVTKGGKELESGALCTEQDTLQLTAKIDTANYTVAKWLINGFKDNTLSGDVVSYTVYNSKAKTESTAKVISIGFEAKAKPAATETTIAVNFDKTKMSCTRFDYMTSSTVTVEPGTKLEPYTSLTFTAALQPGEAVAAWRVNGVVKTSEWSVNNTYSYTINENDLEADTRIVEITYDKK